MKRVILHLGSHKTGSSSIQYSLNQSRSELETLRVFMPPLVPTYLKKNSDVFSIAAKLRSEGNYWDYSYSLRNSDSESLKKDAFKLISTELNTPDLSTLIISTEDFSTLNAEQIRRFRSCFLEEDIEFHLIYFLRHQTETLVGLFQTELVHLAHQIEDFDTFILNRKQQFRYDEIIDRWSTHFAFASINLIDYMSANTVESIDSVKEFSDILRRILNVQIDLPNTVRVNRGIGTKTMRWLDQLHLHLGPDTRDEVVSFLSSLDPRTEKQVEFLTKKEFADLDEEFAINNDNIYKKFNLKLSQPDSKIKSHLLNNRPGLGDLFVQLVTSNSALLKSLTKDQRIRVIEEDKEPLNPYAELEITAIKESISVSLNSDQVIGSSFVPKFPLAVERGHDGSNETSDISNYLIQIDQIRETVDGASRILHLGCKWGYMTRLLFSLSKNVEIYCSDLNSAWVKTIRKNTPFAHAFFIDDRCMIPFRNEFSDVVVADHSFVSYLGAEKLRSYLDEISRILCLGGYVFFNSISMTVEDMDLDTLNIDTAHCKQQTGGAFVFNLDYLKKVLPPELDIKSSLSNSAFDYYVLQKI